jgi:hypothetical protein
MGKTPPHPNTLKILMGLKVKKHGGARKGAGRKPKEPTKVMRIPVSKIQAVTNLIKNEV